MPPIWFTKDTEMAVTSDRNKRQAMSTAKAKPAKKVDLVTNANPLLKDISKGKKGFNK